MEELAKNQETLVAPALCLDIDGTVRRSKSGKTFIEGPDDIELIPGVEEKIDTYKKAGYLIFGISNQGGIAHGFKTQQQVGDEFVATVNLFKKNPFVIIISSPSDKNGSVFPYNYRSLCRKPDIGMLVLAEDYARTSLNIVIDWDNSLFVGDRPEDKECAENAKISFKHIDDFLKDTKDGSTHE